MKFCKAGLFLALLVAACFPAAAQQVQELRLDIPFNFVVAGKTLPAGHYNLKRVLSDSNMAWTIDGDHKSVMVLTQAVQSAQKAHEPSLIFLKSGDQYSLVQIWDAAHWGRQLPQSNVKQTLVAEGSEYVQVSAE